MTDEITQPSETPEVVESAPTLDDVISEFNVQAPVAATPQNNVQEFKPAQATQHIDPYDENQLNQWANQTANNQSQLQQQVQDLNSKISSYEQSQAQAKVDADIKTAVSKVTGKVEGLDPLMAEIYLEKRATENAGFKAIWDNRDANPKALDAALNALSNELDGKFTFKADPQIAENHRAAQQSQQSNATPKASEHGSPLEEQLANAKSEGERQVIWTNAKNLGY